MTCTQAAHEYASRRVVIVKGMARYPNEHYVTSSNDEPHLVQHLLA